MSFKPYVVWVIKYIFFGHLVENSKPDSNSSSSLLRIHIPCKIFNAENAYSHKFNVSEILFCLSDEMDNF